jgi:glycosyltransferase involved in cell wall biosynthesis
MATNKIFLSVIIPMFNESENLKRGVLEEVDSFLKKQDYESEVIISDDGSTDEGVEIVKKYIKDRSRFQLLANPHGGKPYAVRAGVEAAQGKIVLFTDMDQSTPIEELNKLLLYFDKGFDIVIGSRGMARQDFPWYRKLMAFGFRTFRRMMLLKDIVDTQCGFKAFKREVIKNLFGDLQIFEEAKKVKGWRVGAFDVELLFLAQKRGYKVAEVPVEWQDRDITRGKQRKFINESKEMLKEILRVKLNDLRGIYG